MEHRNVIGFMVRNQDDIIKMNNIIGSILNTMNRDPKENENHVVSGFNPELYKFIDELEKK